MRPYHRKPVKECIRNFTPAWFALSMGTGVISALASRFHFGAGSLPLEVIALAFFFLNLVLFVSVCGCTIARYWMFPEMWRKMLYHPAQSLFVGGFPMALCTLINASVMAHEQWSFAGTGFLYALWGFWWLDLLVSFLCAFGMLHVMMTTQSHSLAGLTSAWVLPMVTLIVVSSSGGLIAKSLFPHSPFHALLTTSVSIIAVIMGLSLATMVLTFYLVRLIIYGPPDSSLILSTFITLGPFGQGGFSLLLNGENLAVALPLHMGESFPWAAQTGQLIYGACFCVAWSFWAMGIMWGFISLSSVYAVICNGPVPFSLAYWGLIFPLGVFGLLSVQLGIVLQSPFFNYFGAIWSVMVLLIWIVVFAKTIPIVWDTSIFAAPGATNLSIPLSDHKNEQAVLSDSSHPSLSLA